MRAILLLIGTLIGAGFASGKEISIFFLSSNQYAWLGLALSSLLLGILLYKTMRLVTENHITHYKEWIQAIVPKNIPYFATIWNNIMNIFLLLSFYIMVAGFASYFHQETKLPMLIGILCIVCLTYIACKGNLQTITRISSIVIPILILMILHIWWQNVDIATVKTSFFEDTEASISSACAKAILYTSYNSIVLLPIIIEITQNRTSKSKAIYIASTTAVAVCILGWCLCMLLYQAGTPQLLQKDLPLLEIIGNLQPSFRRIYGVMIAIAIVTSAIAALYGYLKNITKTEKQYKQWLAVLCISAIPIAYIGFSNLIQSIYPVFGMIGSLQIFFLLCKRK